MDIHNRYTALISCPLRVRLQQLGRYSFWFFLIKGLLWLIVPALLVWGSQ